MKGKEKNSEKDDLSHMNKAYIYDEGHGGGGPDTRSANSASSRGSARSSIKILTTKLKTKGRARWVALAVIILVVVVLVTAITTAVYFTTTDTEDVMFSQLSATKPRDTTLHSNASSSTAAPTSRKLTNAITTPLPTTPKVTTPSYTTTTPVIIDRTTPSNLSVSMKDVLYSPKDTNYLSLICEGKHSGNWNSMTIRRQFKDSYEPVAVIAKQINGGTDVHVFYPNLTFYKIVFNYEVTLSVTFEVFACEDLTNFTCALDTNDKTVAAKAKISIYMEEPEIFLPHAIVEDRLVTMSCFAEVWGYDGSLFWKIKPAGADAFMDFSAEPVIEEKQTNCTKTINSTLSITKHENGSQFRCELQSEWVNTEIVQERTDEVTLFVVPSNFCDGKREFTIHPHPHEPCTLAVYCINSGPLVYEIECAPGKCYDSKRTSCVPQVT